MFLHRLSTDTILRINRRLCALPWPLWVATRGLRLRLWEEVHHRACEAELTRRGYGRAPIEILGHTDVRTTQIYAHLAPRV